MYDRGDNIILYLMSNKCHFHTYTIYLTHKISFQTWRLKEIFKRSQKIQFEHFRCYLALLELLQENLEEKESVVIKG